MLKKMLIIIGVFASFSLLAEKVTMTCPSISCSSCEGKIVKTLSTIEGIDKNSVSINLEKKTVQFDYKINNQNRSNDKMKLEQKLNKEMQDLGYPVVGNLVWMDDSSNTPVKK